MIAFDCTFHRPDFTLTAEFRAQNGITALFGPSGSGKSTILRIIAGLERPDLGTISIGDDCLFDAERRINVPPHRRRIALVFQDALLLPHLSVERNLLYGRPRGDEPRRLGMDAVVDTLGIAHLLRRRPDSLSGGERQRVAIGRALLAEPRLLMMDEPLASLDQARKDEILPLIERLRDEFAVPILYVSHSAAEVRRLAQQVILLDGGRVVRQGDPAALLSAPV